MCSCSVTDARGTADVGRARRRGKVSYEGILRESKNRSYSILQSILDRYSALEQRRPSSRALPSV